MSMTTGEQLTLDGGSICWHADGSTSHDCPGQKGDDRMLWRYGRCRSGSRWFWAADCYDWRAGASEQITEHGWADTEDAALRDARETIQRRAGNRPGIAYVRQGVASDVLKQVNAARRKARPPSDATDARVVEYLYEPWSWTDYDSIPYETSKGISEIPIVKKTAKRICYDNTSRWDQEDGVVTLGFIDRQEFEGDTRCRDICPVDAQVTRCSSHRLSYPHCVHVHAFTGRRKAGYEAHREHCARQCPLDVTRAECVKHGYTFEHCPHGHSPETCFHGSPAGAARLPSSSEHLGGGTVFATREAAEADLYAHQREQERKRAEAEPELKRLRMEMADAHPDRGGTNEGFMAARQRYKEALRRAS
jgi:hypothetical protein